MSDQGMIEYLGLLCGLCGHRWRRKVSTIDFKALRDAVCPSCCVKGYVHIRRVDRVPADTARNLVNRGVRP